jgi:CDP-diacylglycerol--glycerol-3-phosphate 3-phosphatidyltransferase
MWGGLIMVIAALTDKLDGVFARRYHEVTEWGKILDPLADKIAVGVAAIVLLKLDAIPLWFVIAILARDLLIFVGGMYLKRRQGVVLQSNETGKWAVGIIALTLFLMVVGIRSIVTDVLIAATLILLIVSLSFYLVRFAEEMKKPVE